MKQTSFRPPAADTTPGRGGRSRLTLPPDLLRDSVRRLRVVAVLVAIASSLNFVVFTFLLSHSRLSAIDAVCMPALIGISITLFALGRANWLSAAAMLDLGLVYEVAVALLLGLMINEGPWPQDRMMPSWSPVALWVVFFPLLVPNRWVKALPVAILAAAMDPISLAIATRLGADPPSVEIALARFTPNILAVGIGALASQIIYRLGSQVGQARDAGSYHLEERLGEGGMGEVWRARHRMLARPAAVKLIRPAALGSLSLTQLERVRTRFAKEAQATAALRSPHTVVLYDYGTTREGEFYYVMELLDGLDLESLVLRYGPVPPARAVHLLLQACHSLGEAHAKGMVHRDVKPANLFACHLGSDFDFLKVLDFGLVKRPANPEDGDGLATGEHVFAGTPAYVAPEVAIRADAARPASDVYALGCVAYWLLSGQLVFEAKTAVAVISRHVSDAPPALASRTELEVPAPLEDLVMECLRKNPADRPRDATELAERLEGLPVAGAWSRADARGWWKTHHPEDGNVGGPAQP